MGKLEDTRHSAHSGSTDALPVDKPVEVLLPGSKRRIEVLRGDFKELPQTMQEFITTNVELCDPSALYICDGSEEEASELKELLINNGNLTKLEKMDNCYLCRTDPADVARVESKTFLVTPSEHDSVPHVAKGTKGILGQWMAPDVFKQEADSRFPGCMKGRVMYVIPFSMGPVGSALARVGVQLTDFAYVVLSMRIMTRIGARVLHVLQEQGAHAQFVRCLHSVGCPLPLKRALTNNWPCDPSRIIIAHLPDERLIMSYGSGYGGNSLLGKKCFALRIASRIARDEGWLAEHMMLMSAVNPRGEEKFIAGAFPSACGKTNMAMLQSKMPGWHVQCIGDDIAWMRFDSQGRLRAINPEAGFFGVAPGTNHSTNPMAMATVAKDTIFTNVAMTEDGGVFWEGMEKETDPNVTMTTWLGQPWKLGQGGKAAHPNSRFCTPAANCPLIHPRWEDPEGVPIDMIVFGGRRPQGVPLVFEANSWEHGVMLGAALKSENTAAAEHKGKQIMHDPMAMRPFMGYNFGAYLQNWLELNKPGRRMPKIFHVNWFRLDDNGKFLWPGFGENIRVIEWMFRRCDGEAIATPSPIGLLPASGSLNISGLKSPVNMAELFHLPRDYWLEDVRETRDFLDKQVGCDLPHEIRDQVDQLESRILRDL